MIHFLIQQHNHGNPVAAGAASAEIHAATCLRMIEADAIPDVGLICAFDFSGIELVSASYLKNTLRWALACGRLSAGNLSADELVPAGSVAVKPLNIFPVALGANEEVADAIHEFFAGRGCPFVLVNQKEGDGFARGRVIGRLEAAPARTLQLIGPDEEVTADDLFRRAANDEVNVKAWNNRLAELHRLRVLLRRKAGKSFKFRTIAKEQKYG